MDKASIPIVTLVDQYLSACRSSGMSPKTMRGYNEKLKRYVRTVGGTLGDFTLEAVRQHLTSLQKAKKWEGHPIPMGRIAQPIHYFSRSSTRS